VTSTVRPVVGPPKIQSFAIFLQSNPAHSKTFYQQHQTYHFTLTTIISLTHCPDKLESMFQKFARHLMFLINWDPLKITWMNTEFYQPCSLHREAFHCYLFGIVSYTCWQLIACTCAYKCCGLLCGKWWRFCCCPSFASCEDQYLFTLHGGQLFLFRILCDGRPWIVFHMLFNFIHGVNKYRSKSPCLVYSLITMFD